MKTWLLLLFVLLAVPDALAQKRTIERRTPVDSTTTVIITETEDITPRHHMFVVDPLRFFALFNLSYYQRVASNVAVGGGLQLPAFEDVDGFIAQGEVRLYPGNRALRGFYVAPNLWFSTLNVDDDDEARLSAGVIAGWQWFTKHNFGIEFGLGLRHRLTDDRDWDFYDGARPAVRFRIGYAL